MKVPFKLYNTLTRQVETLQPQDGEAVSIYTCGPTVYGDQHVGNYRTFIFEDVLVKTLRQLGCQVKRVMNITDVGHLTSDADEGEDKLEVGAAREGVSAWEIAKKYEERFISDLTELNLEKPELIRATDTIEAQINLIKELEAKGFTYQTGDGVYFDSSKVSDYGKLAQLDISGLQAGARVEMGEKKHPTDFALWKLSPADRQRDMEWESPWGKGFPGWHLECSAIIRQALGDSITIHCGGVDHIPIHHTNEIAQSEAATGQPLAQIWAHAEFLLMDGGKMAKSLGNLYTLEDLKQSGYDPLAFKLFCFSASYRSKLNFTWDALSGAQVSLERLKAAFQAEGKGEETDFSSYEQRFLEALADDLNTPQALAVVWEALDAPLSQPARQAFLRQVDHVFGLALDQPAATIEITEAQQALLTEREAARKAGDWTTADALRNKLWEAGLLVEDTPEGQHVRRRR